MRVQHLFIPGISSWQHPVLFLRDVPFADLYTILEFIYMGEVTVAHTDLTSFLQTAELLQIKGLAEYTATGQDMAEYDDNDDTCETFTSASPQSNMCTPTGIGGQRVCTVCGIVILKKNFPRHFRDKHTGPKPRSLCPLCQKSYKTSDWLKDSA